MARINIPNTGLWSAIAAILNNLFTQLFQFKYVGIYDYNDAGTSITPVSVTAAAGWVDLPNDGNGQFTTKYPLDTVSEVWDPLTNTFDFSSLDIGDSVEIRFDASAVTSNPNQEVKVRLLLAVGTPAEYALKWVSAYPKNAGTYDALRWNGFYIGNPETRNNPAKFQIESDGNMDVTVNGWYIKVTKQAMELV